MGDGYDFPGLIDESVPGVAAVIDHVVVAFEDAVRKPVLTHELPDVFLGIEFGRARRQRQQRDVAWDLERCGAMPAGLIEEEDGMGTGSDPGGDLVEMKLHGFGIAVRQYDGGASAALRAYCPEQVGGLGPLIVGGSRTRSRPGPAIGELVLLADPHLVLEPDLYRRARSELCTDFRQAAGEVFLKACMTSASC